MHFFFAPLATPVDSLSLRERAGVRAGEGKSATEKNLCDNRDAAFTKRGVMK